MKTATNSTPFKNISQEDCLYVFEWIGGGKKVVRFWALAFNKKSNSIISLN